MRVLSEALCKHLVKQVLQQVTLHLRLQCLCTFEVLPLLAFLSPPPFHLGRTTSTGIVFAAICDENYLLQPRVGLAPAQSASPFYHFRSNHM